MVGMVWYGIAVNELRASLTHNVGGERDLHVCICMGYPLVRIESSCISGVNGALH